MLILADRPILWPSAPEWPPTLGSRGGSRAGRRRSPGRSRAARRPPRPRRRGRRGRTRPVPTRDACAMSRPGRARAALPLVARRRADACGGSCGLQRIANELHVPALARGWADVRSFDLDPGMGLVVARLVVQADHELGGRSLLAQEPEEDERRGQAPRPERAEVQRSVNGQAEVTGTKRWCKRVDPGKVVREAWERRPGESALHPRVRAPDAEREPRLRARVEPHGGRFRRRSRQCARPSVAGRRT